MMIPIKLEKRTEGEQKAYAEGYAAGKRHAVRHGRWIWDDEGYHCSECFFHAYGNTLECMDGTYAYCPNCGARMVNEDD